MAYRYANTFPQHLHKLCVVCGNVSGFFPPHVLCLFIFPWWKSRGIAPQCPNRREVVGGEGKVLLKDKQAKKSVCRQSNDVRPGSSLQQRSSLPHPSTRPSSSTTSLRNNLSVKKMHVRRAEAAARSRGASISQDRFVTKWASYEYHLDTTYLKLAPVPWQPAWQPRDGNKLHHLLNMHLTWCLLKDHD